ncbi:hypothetical protein [Jannaschia sp. LMIT008]|uniref:hypothetical protein n=1 Tax=Jannaschia maritima TaxID=3032585 RepID=UPI002811302E|nr:hypothetical protein [Jannaschia sp. LMIT008]
MQDEAAIAPIAWIAAENDVVSLLYEIGGVGVTEECRHLGGGLGGSVDTSTRAGAP